MFLKFDILRNRNPPEAIATNKYIHAKNVASFRISSIFGFANALTVLDVTKPNTGCIAPVASAPIVPHVTTHLISDNKVIKRIRCSSIIFGFFF